MEEPGQYFTFCCKNVGFFVKGGAARTVFFCMSLKLSRTKERRRTGDYFLKECENTSCATSECIFYTSNVIKASTHGREG